MSQAVSPPAKNPAGLEGIVAAPSEICFIDGLEGRLVYRGYDIADLVENATFEETAFLLWTARLPNRSELTQLKSQLGVHAALPPHTLAVLKALPASTEPMDALRTAASSLSSTDPDLQNNDPAANLRKAIRLTAQLPTIVAAFDRLRRGHKPIQPDPHASIAGNFLHMLNGSRAHETLVRVLDAALVLHAEHGFNASTFAARITAATLADMHAAVTAALGALKGPLHGGANQEVMQLLLECGDAPTAAKRVRAMLDAGQKIPGFGHRVYKTFDPRAAFLRKLSRHLGEVAGDTKWYEMSEELIPIVKEMKNKDPNVDFFSASAYYVMGIPIDLYTPIFAIARIAGWTAHIMEQHANNRIIRPQDDYRGPFGLKVVPIHQR
ncbi:MAG: citrate/2-methylcitrate synthase [Tepidisphaeraceae bacterium]|jgi:citrate synthase